MKIEYERTNDFDMNEIKGYNFINELKRNKINKLT